MLLDVVAVLLWSTCWTTAGYVLGAAALAVLREAGDAGRWILVAVAVIAIAALLVRRRRRKAAGPSPREGKPGA
jgi:MYXO-CTERM domain-containing protein